MQIEVGKKDILERGIPGGATPLSKCLTNLVSHVSHEETTFCKPCPTNCVSIVSQKNNNCQYDNYNLNEILPPNLFKTPANHKKRSNIIQEIIIKLEESFFRPTKCLTNLVRHISKKNRQVRTEAREAAIHVLQAMVYWVDDATGKFGHYLGSKFENYSLSDLSKKTGLHPRRIVRALRLIAKAGYMRVTRQFNRRENGDFEGTASIREFLPRFFIDLGIKGALYNKWIKLQEWKKERDHAKSRKRARKEGGVMSRFISDTMRLNRPTKNVIGNRDVNLCDRESEKKKIRIARALQLFNLDPSKTVSQHYNDVVKAHPM